MKHYTEDEKIRIQAAIKENEEFTEHLAEQLIGNLTRSIHLIAASDMCDADFMSCIAQGTAEACENFRMAFDDLAGNDID